jgi:hypothetical protein
MEWVWDGREHLLHHMEQVTGVYLLCTDEGVLQTDKADYLWHLHRQSDAMLCMHTMNMIGGGRQYLFPASKTDILIHVLFMLPALFG